MSARGAELATVDAAILTVTLSFPHGDTLGEGPQVLIRTEWLNRWIAGQTVHRVTSSRPDLRACLIACPATVSSDPPATGSTSSSASILATASTIFCSSRVAGADTREACSSRRKKPG